jgi:hypothetical protein
MGGAETLRLGALGGVARDLVGPFQQAAQTQVGRGRGERGAARDDRSR